MEEAADRKRVDRRALLRNAAAAGAIGWTAPVILSSGPVSAGVFTAKCAPGAVTVSSVSFVRGACRSNNSDITITINFAGVCPCGGTRLWCTRKSTPTPVVTGTTSTLVFLVTVPVLSPIAPITITGRVALGCTDRSGDTQYAVYNWSMTAQDNGQPCDTVINTISGVTLSGRTLVTSVGCPPATLASAPLTASSASTSTPGTRRSAP
jgi:hypothetical protein